MIQIRKEENQKKQKEKKLKVTKSIPTRRGQLRAPRHVLVDNLKREAAEDVHGKRGHGKPAARRQRRFQRIAQRSAQKPISSTSGVNDRGLRNACSTESAMLPCTMPSSG